jgi:hypothetical protein
VRALTDDGPAPLQLVVTAVALLAGPLLAWVGASNLRRERAGQRRAVRLAGEVVGAEWRLVGGVGTESAEPLSFPVIRYTEPSGAERTFVADVGTGTVTATHTRVDVLHDPTGAAPPQLAGLRSRAVLPAALLAAGCVLTSLGLGLLLALR